MKRLFLSTVAALAMVTSAALGAQSNPKLLSDADDKRWTEAANNHVTADGATVLQVLQYAEMMRPREFKNRSADVGYNGASEPKGVMACYWIGAKRLPDDAVCDIRYKVLVEGSKLKISPEIFEGYQDTITEAVEGGREYFLRYIDKEYETECIDSATKEKLC